MMCDGGMMSECLCGCIMFRFTMKGTVFALFDFILICLIEK